MRALGSIMVVVVVAAVGCSGGGDGGGGGAAVPAFSGSISAPDLTDGAGAGGALAAAPLAAAAAVAAPPRRLGRFRLALADGQGCPVPIGPPDVQLTILETDAALRLRTRTTAAQGAYPLPPLAPFPGKSSATLSGGSVLLREKQRGGGARDVEAFSFAAGARLRYTIAADGTLARAHPRNPDAAPDIALVGGALVELTVGGVGEPVLARPVAAALLGPVSYAGPAATTFERYVSAPPDGYGPIPLEAGNAYALRLASGRFAKVHVVGRRVWAGGTHARIDLDWVYQCDGTRDLAPNWVAVDPGSIAVGDPDPPALAVGLVADNSGSEQGFLDPLKAGLHEFIAALDPARDGASLVRVSTEATLRAPLGSDRATLDAATDALFVANGWTALYDGIRLGAESLESGFSADPAAPAPVPALVVFTDGKDNNSADEKDTQFAGDGIDTTLEDCLSLEAGGIAIPVHTIAVGDADREELAELAAATGGRAYDIAHPDALSQAYGAIRASIDASTGVVFESGFADTGAFARRTAFVLAKVTKHKKSVYVAGYVVLGSRSTESACALGSAAKVRVGHRPRAAAVIPGAGRLLVANAGEGTLSLVDLAAAAEVDWDGDPTTRSRGAPLGVSRLAVGRRPSAVAVTAGGDRAVVANEGDGTVSIVDLVAGVETARVAVSRGPCAVALTADGAAAYVACRLDDAVARVDLATRAVTIYPVGDDPSALALRGSVLWVVEANLSSAGNPGALVARDAATLEPLSTIAVGRAPGSIALSPGGQRAYLTNRRSGTFSIVNIADPAAPSIVRNLLVAGKNPGGIAVSRDGALVSCALAGEDAVATFLRADPDVSCERLRTGRSPSQVVFAEDAQTLVTVDTGSDSVSLRPLPQPLP